MEARLVYSRIVFGYETIRKGLLRTPGWNASLDGITQTERFPRAGGGKGRLRADPSVIVFYVTTSINAEPRRAGDSIQPEAAEIFCEN